MYPWFLQYFQVFEDKRVSYSVPSNNIFILEHIKPLFLRILSLRKAYFAIIKENAKFPFNTNN